MHARDYQHVIHTRLLGIVDNMLSRNGFQIPGVDVEMLTGLGSGAMTVISSSSDDDLIRPAAAARLAGVTTRTLTNWVKDGKLAAIKTAGGQRRYRRGDVQNMIQPAKTG